MRPSLSSARAPALLAAAFLLALALAIPVPPAEGSLIVLGDQPVKPPELLALEAAAQGGAPEAAWRLGVFLAAPAESGALANAAEAEKWLRQALANGETRARTPLGKLLLETSNQGQSVDRAAEGLQLLREAAESDPGANLLLGLLHAEGRFAKHDFESAERHFAEAARLGEPAGEFRLGWLHSGAAGFPDEAQPELAARHLESAFAEGSNEAGALLFQLLQEGTRLPQDAERAFRIVAEVAARGDAEARYLEGKLHEQGIGVAADPAKALEAYLEAAEAGHAPAQNEAGLVYANGSPAAAADLAQALAWFERAAEQGHAPARLNLAVLLDRDAEPGSAEGRRAMEHLVEAASAGIPDAQDLLGAWYRDGKHGPRDFNAAAAWFRDAATAGSLPAAINLAQLLESVGQQPGALADAVSLYRQAAEAGHPIAHFHYARLLAGGALGPSDLAASYAHLQAAAEAGFPLAQENLPRLEAALSEAQRSRAAEIREQLRWFAWEGL